MAFYLYSTLVVAIVAVSVNNCSALSDEQKELLKEKLKANVAECGPQYGVSFEDLLKWKEQKKIPDDTNKCFHACMFKKSGLLDDKGLFSESVGVEKVKLYVSADKLADATAAVKICAAVNEQAVSDGDAGCDRAVLLAKCIHEQKELLGFPA
uniref:Odorant-binding protein OBP1 n=1 Tax=Lobesia botrana TaxID=209534 RepID=A0A345BEP6_9NEOP|nr:odorant-binding protein OBP1 [Lobesia botrana]